MKFTDLVFDREGLFGPIAKVNFANGYSASVIANIANLQFEVAVEKDREIVYDTPVTSDVLKHLNIDELEDTLAFIEALPVSLEEIELWLENEIIQGLIVSIIDNKDDKILPILADALEDIDCNNKILLNDLRTSKRLCKHWFINLVYENLIL